MILANSTNYGGKRSKIEWIVIHYTGNYGDTAKNNCKYFQGANRNASAHYFVDELGYEQSVPDDHAAYSVGKLYNSGAALYWAICNNKNSISIEMCNSMAHNEAVENRTIALIKELMSKYHIDFSHVVRHYDVCGKACPLTLLPEAEWARFKSKLCAKSPDNELINAVNKIVQSGVKIDKTYWNSLFVINLKYVPHLITKLGGFTYLVNNHIIEEPDLWTTERYTIYSVRSLLIKYANRLL